MDGERASSTRQRLAGKVCCACRNSLPPDPTGERYCERCAPRRRICMHYMLATGGWYCQFLEEDLKTPLRRTFTFATEEKVLDMAKRGGAEWTSDREAMEYGLRQGRGNVWLRLTAEQYAKLR